MCVCVCVCHVFILAMQRQTHNLVCFPQVCFAQPGVRDTKRTYFSADAVVEPWEVHDWPLELLYTLTPPDMPPHELHLQVGGPVVLLRSLGSTLDIGTRLLVTGVPSVFCIEAQVMTGPEQGERILIPRLDLTPLVRQNYGFTLRRRQFPVRPAFAMTVQEAAGQSFEKIGLYLPIPKFSHAMLCEALSRVGGSADVKVLVKDGWQTHARLQNDLGKAPHGVYTTNVVYKDPYYSRRCGFG